MPLEVLFAEYATSTLAFRSKLGWQLCGIKDNRVIRRTNRGLRPDCYLSILPEKRARNRSCWDVFVIWLDVCW
jgi:hypothetical protein